MILNSNEIANDLIKFINGEIEQGVGIGCKLIDDYTLFKKGSFNILLGHDNVGKTYFKTWYYLALSVKYDFKWCIWTGENKAWQIVRNLIQFLSGKHIKELELKDIQYYQHQINNWFDFVDNSKVYKYNDLLKIFESKDYTGALIDPYTGLNRNYGHSDNYEFLNKTRQWVNSTGITIDVCTHPVTSSARIQGHYPKGHQYEGYLKEPYKADTEGGKPFSNRCDDFLILHRMANHPVYKYTTFLFVEKVKDVESGGQVTMKDTPIELEFNNGLGFTLNGFNPILKTTSSLNVGKFDTRSYLDDHKNKEFYDELDKDNKLPF